MNLVFIMILCFISAGLLFYALIPFVTTTTTDLNKKRAEKFATKMERVLMKSDIHKMSRFLLVTPVLGAAVGYLFFPLEFRLAGMITCMIAGFVFPNLYIKFLIKKRRNKFYDQLIDALMIMSSSFRGGLSLIQAMEAVVEEMPDPIDQEFGTVLSENKMGVSLEEALNHLYERMPSPALQQTMTAILLARETGGNLPSIFSRIVNTIREQKKIQDNIATLTLQGKIQGFVMSLLPIAFGFVVYSTNPHFFQNMIHSQIGRMLLAYAAVSEVIGAFLIWRISTFKDY